jgi:tryptophan synthase alpha chain
VTGASTSLAEGLAASVARVRRATPLPIAVGFGISSATQVRTVGRLADGVVVGSALVDLLGKEGVSGVRRLLGELRTALGAGVEEAG